MGECMVSFGQKPRLDLGKCWGMAMGGLLVCFIKTPYAKATMFKFLIGWSVGFNVGVVWGKSGMV